MADKLEKLVRFIYRRWKKDRSLPDKHHPDEEVIACFLEGKLAQDESEAIRAHILNCNFCVERVSLDLEISDLNLRNASPELLQRVTGLISASDILEISLKLRDRFLEVLNITHDALVDARLIPESALRSRKITGFKRVIRVSKVFAATRVELEIERKEKQSFSVFIALKDKRNKGIKRDLKIALYMGDIEIESYSVTAGKALFEHVLPGQYRIEIAQAKGKICSILINVVSELVE